MSSEQPNTRTKGYAVIPAVALGFALALLTGGLFLYSWVLTSVDYDCELEPATLFAGSTESAELRMYGINRMGGHVPFSQQRFRVHIERGTTLVTMNVSEDSTLYTLHSTGLPGEVQLYMITDNWPFPMMATLRIVTPMAHLQTRISRRNT